MRNSLLIFLGFVLLVGPTRAVTLARTWTDSTGTYSTEAEYAGLTKDGQVKLLKANGKTVLVPLKKLSESDQKYVDSVVSDQQKPPAAGPDVAPKNQAEAIAMIKKLGGKIERDLKHPDHPVVSVNFSGCRELTDADLAILKEFTQLKTLLLGYTKVTDAGLVHIKGLTKLQLLGLGITKVTGAGLVHIKGLTQLQYLRLEETGVTDAGMEHLKGFTKLQVLGLRKTKVTGAGMEHLKGLKQLQTLYLWDTQVTDAGVKKLQESLPKCKIYH